MSDGLMFWFYNYFILLFLVLLVSKSHLVEMWVAYKLNK